MDGEQITNNQVCTRLSQGHRAGVDRSQDGLRADLSFRCLLAP